MDAWFPSARYDVAGPMRMNLSAKVSSSGSLHIVVHAGESMAQLESMLHLLPIVHMVQALEYFFH